MKRIPPLRCLIVLSASALIAACASPEPPAPAAGETPPDATAGSLPEGHPPLPESGSSSPSGIVPPPPGSGSGATGMTWTVPEDWESVPPSSRMRRAQYRVPGEAGDAECVVFYFGPGQGGDAMANAQRWAKQFEQPDGSDPVAAMETREIDVDGVPVLMVEVTGTYNGGGPMMGGSAEPLPDHMLLGAIVSGPDANWFFKLTGPAGTVEAAQDEFESLIRSLREGGSRVSSG